MARPRPARRTRRPTVRYGRFIRSNRPADARQEVRSGSTRQAPAGRSDSASVRSARVRRRRCRVVSVGTPNWRRSDGLVRHALTFLDFVVRPFHLCSVSHLRLSSPAPCSFVSVTLPIRSFRRFCLDLPIHARTLSINMHEISIDHEYAPFFSFSFVTLIVGSISYPIVRITFSEYLSCHLSCPNTVSLCLSLSFCSVCL